MSSPNQNILLGTLGGMPLQNSGKANLVTISGGTADIGEEMIIPNLLHYTGSVIVTDPSGEYFKRTATRRKELGQHIVKIDPFGVVDGNTDVFNPLDILRYSEDHTIDDINLIVDEIVDGDMPDSFFWDTQSKNLLRGLLLYLATMRMEQCSIPSVLNILLDEEMDVNLAVILKTYGSNLNEYSKIALSKYLSQAVKSRGGIAKTLLAYILRLNTPLVKNVLKETSFDLRSIRSNQLYTIYLIVPVDKQQPYFVLYNLWITALCLLLETRPSEKGKKVLLLITEPQILNKKRLNNRAWLNQLAEVQVWSFWNDVSQLKKSMHNQWCLLINDHPVFQVMTPADPLIADELNLYLYLPDLRKQTFNEREYMVLIENEWHTGVAPLVSEQARSSKSNSAVCFINGRRDLVLNKGPLSDDEAMPSMVCVDINGTYYASTGDGRRKLGHRIIKLDPFHVVEQASECFNPLDLLLEKENPEISEIFCFVENVLFYSDTGKDVFWESNAKAILTGLIKYYSLANRRLRLDKLKDLLQKDLSARLLLYADKTKEIDPTASALLLNAAKTFAVINDATTSLLADICSRFLTGLSSPEVINSLSHTSFDLHGNRLKKPFAIYLILPLAKLKAYENLLRLWVVSLYGWAAALDRKNDDKVFFLLDFASAAGNIPFYQQLAKSSKNSSIDLWTGWNSLGELKKTFPSDWKTILATSSCIEVFGIQKPIVSQAFAPIFGLSVHELKTAAHNYAYKRK